LRVRSSDCLSVCLFHQSTATTAIGGFAAERPVGKRYRSITAVAVLRAPALGSNAGSVMLRADGEGSTQTCVVCLTVGVPANGVEKLSNGSLTMPYGMNFSYILIALQYSGSLGSPVVRAKGTGPPSIFIYLGRWTRNPMFVSSTPRCRAVSKHTDFTVLFFPMQLCYISTLYSCM